jgi:hypothetical protein
MDQEVRSIEKKYKYLKNGKQLKVLITVSIFILLIAGTGLYISLFRDRSPIPMRILRSVNYPLYFPDPVPTTYALQKDSLNYSNGVVSYNFQHVPKDSKIIYVIEQALPSKPPDLQKLVDLLSFRKIDTVVGTAVLGQNEGNQTAILNTNTTLITVTSTKDTPDDITISVLKNMHVISK